MKTLLAFALVACAAFASFADSADILNELQRKSVEMECKRSPKLGDMYHRHCIGAADVGGVTNRVYTGSAITFDPVVKLGGTTLTEGTQYTQSFTNNTNVGRATVKLSSNANGYFGSLTKAFVITPAPASSVVVSNIANQVYTGSALTPKPAVVFGTATLTENTDYTLSYENNVAKSANAKCIVTFKGNFEGATVKQFTIAD